MKFRSNRLHHHRSVLFLSCSKWHFTYCCISLASGFSDGFGVKYADNTQRITFYHYFNSAARRHEVNTHENSDLKRRGGIESDSDTNLTH